MKKLNKSDVYEITGGYCKTTFERNKDAACEEVKTCNNKFGESKSRTVTSSTNCLGLP